MKLIYSGDYSLRIIQSVRRLEHVIEDLEECAKDWAGDKLEKIYKDLANQLSDKVKKYKVDYEMAERQGDLVYNNIKLANNYSHLEMEILERELMEKGLTFYVWCKGYTGATRVEYDYRLAIKIH